MMNILFKALKTFGGTGGDIVNCLSKGSHRCLPPVTDEILLMPTHKLAAKIRRRELTSEQVVRAFINRTRLVHAYLNAIIDERFDDAIEDAKAIDEFLKTTTLSEEELATQKPFLGLPFTAKDSIQVAGMKWTSGCLRRKDIISYEDAPVVKNFRKAGAIPIALTNVPELLLWFASSNKLYGTTNNPFDLTRTPGGSSGGEAALVSAAGTPLSICSDIGGSIRMPAFHCGLFGHKPTHKIIDYHGTFPQIEDGLEEIFSFGPICRFADDLLPSLRVMAGDNFHLFRDIEKPVDLKKIRVFYLDECGDDMSTEVEPYIKNSIREAAEHFGSKYNVTVERARFKHFKHISLWYTVLFSNNQDVSKLITDNTYKINPFFELCKSAIGQSDYSPSALTVAAAQATTQATCSAPSVYEKAHESLKLAKKEFNALLGDDGIFIYVSLPRTAPTHYASVFEFTNVCCPMVMNYLGAPTTQVPVSTHEGLPFGIQVAATATNDRLTLAVAKELEGVFGGWIKPFDVSPELGTELNDLCARRTSEKHEVESEYTTSTASSSSSSTTSAFEQLTGSSENAMAPTVEPQAEGVVQEVASF